MAQPTNGFKKGQSGNPAGRAKGSMSEATKNFQVLKKIAADYAQEAFALLEAQMKAGKPWAHKLYWEKLAPKHLDKKAIKIEGK